MKTTELYANRGWDRADLDLDKLAKLAFSIKTSGWQDAHPVVYETLPDGRSEIVWGHRRTLAAVVAEMSNGAETVEDMAAFIETLVTETVEAVVCPVCGAEVDVDLDYCDGCRADLYTYNEETDDTVFIGVNGYIERADMQHLIRDYNTIIHGTEIEVPAQEMEYVSELDSQLKLIGDGLNREDADVVGLSRAIYRAVQMGVTGKVIAGLGMSDNEVASYLAIAQLPKEIGQMVADEQLAFSIPRLIMQVEGHKREALLAMIQPHITVSMVTYYVNRLRDFGIDQPDMLSSPAINNHRKIVALIFNDMLREDPVGTWVHVLKATEVPIPENINELIPEIGCEACPLMGKITQLPKISARGGGYRCQHGEATWCIHNSEQVVADYRVRDRADVHYDNEHYFSSFELASEAYGIVSTETGEEADAAEDTRPIDKQRETIQHFMEAQKEMSGRQHPFATTCESCGYHLNESPVKSNPDAPHCAWAGKRANIEMGALVDEKGYTIPHCLQYMPILDFVEMIPESEVGGLAPGVLVRVLEQLTGVLLMRSVPPLRRLTGVPFKSSERYLDWFDNRLSENSLTPGQVGTLIQWLAAEVDLSNDKPAVLQLASGRTGEFRGL